MNFIDYYKTLEIDKNATTEDIKKGISQACSQVPS